MRVDLDGRYGSGEDTRRPIQGPRPKGGRAPSRHRPAVSRIARKRKTFAAGGRELTGMEPHGVPLRPPRSIPVHGEPGHAVGKWPGILESPRLAFEERLREVDRVVTIYFPAPVAAVPGTSWFSKTSFTLIDRRHHRDPAVGWFPGRLSVLIELHQRAGVGIASRGPAGPLAAGRGAEEGRHAFLLSKHPPPSLSCPRAAAGGRLGSVHPASH